MNILAIILGILFISWDVYNADFMGWKSGTTLGTVLMYGQLVADALLIVGGLMQPVYVGYALVLYGVFRIIRGITDLTVGVGTALPKSSKNPKVSLDTMFYVTRSIDLVLGLALMYWGYTMTTPPVGMATVGGRRRKH